MPAAAPPLGIDAAIVALETTFDAEAAAWMTAVYELTLGDQLFTLEVAAGRLEVSRGHAPAGVTPVASLETDTTTLAAVVWHGHPIDRAVADGALRVQGDPEAASDFVGLFAPPVPTGCPTCPSTGSSMTSTAATSSPASRRCVARRAFTRSTQMTTGW